VERVQRGRRLLTGQQREQGLRWLRQPVEDLPEHLPVGDLGDVHRVLRRGPGLHFIVGMLFPPAVHHQHLRFLPRGGRELLLELGLLRLRVRLVGKMLRRPGRDLFLLA